MALNTAAIQTAIRNVLDGTFTGIRDITAGTFQDDADGATKARALVTPTYDIEINANDVHPASPMSVSGDRAIETLDVMITLSYALPPNMMVTDRYSAQATISNNASLVRQALTMPGNLDDDGAGTPAATGIVSGMLFGPGGQGLPSVTQSRDWASLTATTTINASAVVVVAQLVS